MALERDPQTRTNAARLLMDVGRGSISQHGAQMAVQILEDNGFQIWEVKPDEPAEPTPPPKPVPKRGSLDSLNEKYYQLRDLEWKCDELRKEFRDEFQNALSDFRPVFQAIALALDAAQGEVELPDPPEKED